MEAQVSFDNGIYTIYISGQVNVHSATEFERTLKNTLEQSAKSTLKVVVLEVDTDTHISSSGLKLIFEFHTRCVKSNVRLGVLNHSESAGSVFKLAGLANYIPVRTNMAQLCKVLGVRLPS